MWVKKWLTMTVVKEKQSQVGCTSTRICHPIAPHCVLKNSSTGIKLFQRFFHTDIKINFSCKKPHHTLNFLKLYLVIRTPYWRTIFEFKWFYFLKDVSIVSTNFGENSWGCLHFSVQWYRVVRCKKITDVRHFPSSFFLNSYIWICWYFYSLLRRYRVGLVKVE